MKFKFKFYKKLISIVLFTLILIPCFIISSFAASSEISPTFFGTSYFYEWTSHEYTYFSQPENPDEPMIIFGDLNESYIKGPINNSDFRNKYVVVLLQTSYDISPEVFFAYNSQFLLPALQMTRLNREPFSPKDLQLYGFKFPIDVSFNTMRFDFDYQSATGKNVVIFYGLYVFNSESDAKTYLYSNPPPSSIYGQTFSDIYSEGYDQGYTNANEALGMGSFEGSSVTIKFFDSLGSETYSNFFQASFFYDSSNQIFSFHNWYSANKSTLPQPYKVEITFDLLNLGEDINFFTDSVYPAVSTMNKSVNYMFFGQPSNIVYASAEYIVNTGGGYGLRPDIANASYKYTKFQIFDSSKSDTSAKEPQVFDQYYFLTAASINSESYQLGYKAGYSQGKSDQIRDYDGILQSKLNEEYLRGFDKGYAIGKTDGQQISEENWSFAKLIYAVIDAPLLFLKSILGFEILGINILGLVGVLLTITIVIIVFKKFL